MASRKATVTTVLAAYYFTLVVYLAASFFPEARLWGINWWAYLPGWARWGLFCLGVLVPIIVKFTAKRIGGGSAGDASTGHDRKYFVVAAVVVMGFGLLFYFLRARTYFLGDGYTLLSELAANSPFAMKTREFGESLAHIWLRNLIGGDGNTAALLSHQIISITAGLLFVLFSAWFSRKLYERMVERVLFFLGVCSGGYMILFFGYVENYALFVLSIFTYSLTGLLVALGKANRLWLLPPLVTAVFLHVLGVTLVPSALYLWIAPTRLGRSIQSWKWSSKLLALIPVVAVVGYVFYHFYATSYFFRFAFVPILENRFTVEGYTMFSVKHLMDYLNLLLLLMPGLLVTVAVASLLPVRKLLRERQFAYLAILTASVLGAVFVFDPKLGMPRDWDLFSFAGAPLVVLCFYLIPRANLPSGDAISTAVLSVALCGLVLVPRVADLSLPDIALSRFKYYASLDRLRSMNARTVYQTYLLQHNDSLALKKEVDLFRADYPEWTINEDALSIAEKGRYDLAIPDFRKAIRLNPGFWNAYANLGWCFLRTNRVDSALAYLEWANGMSPNGSRVNYRLGAAYLLAGDYKEAEFRLLKALQLDSDDQEALAGLVTLYQKTGRTEEMLRYLTRLSRLKNSAPEYTAWLGDYYLQDGRYEEAAAAYRRAVDRGLDSSYVLELLPKYPDLQRVWR